MKHTDPRPSEEHIRLCHEYADALLPPLRMVAKRCGYALTTHGSFERDIDIVLIPWREHASPAEEVVSAFFRVCEAVNKFATWPISGTGAMDSPAVKPYGRLGWSIILTGGPYLDISVMPMTGTTP